MSVTAKSLREKIEATKVDGKHDPAARISLPVSDALYLANQLDVLAGTEISPAAINRIKEEGRSEANDKTRQGLSYMRCAIAGQIAKAEIKNLRAAFVANALLDVAEEAWWGAKSSQPASAERLLDATEQMLAAMDRLQEMATWQLVPPVSGDAWQLIRPIASLGLTNRTLRALQAENLSTLGDLVSMPQAHLLRIPNFGRKSLHEIVEVIGALGLRLAG